MQDFRKAEHRILVLWVREEERRQVQLKGAKQNVVDLKICGKRGEL